MTAPLLLGGEGPSSRIISSRIRCRDRAFHRRIRLDRPLEHEHNRGTVVLGLVLPRDTVAIHLAAQNRLSSSLVLARTLNPALSLLDRTAVSLGKSVAVVDSHHELGGAGANTGTVPSKTLRETALALSGMKSRNLLRSWISLCEGKLQCPTSFGTNEP